jgi:hypothetical protein
MGLTKEIARRSAFSPSGSMIPLEISMCVARSTGSSRSQQLFVCRHLGCSARVAFTVSDDVVRFGEVGWTHNHEISAMTCDGPPILDSEMRAEICHLKSLGCTAGQIRLRLGLNISGEMLYNVRRNQLRQYRTGQAVQLENEISTDSDFETCFLRDRDHFAGCYFFTLFFQPPQSVKKLLSWMIHLARTVTVSQFS